jgi:drug/metabolite transporter (DMT)-like permease
VSLERLGEVAALGTALLWTGSYVAFTLAVRRVGADVLNRLRLAVALLFLMLLHTTLYGVPVPVCASAMRWLWLGLSGVVGFAVSDALLFRALFHLGAHRTSLITSLIPVVSSFLAWAVFGESFGTMQFAGVAAVVAGILLVVSGRTTEEGMPSAGNAKLGALFALGAVLTQSTRYLLSVEGMRGGFPVVSTNVIQILVATLAAWVVVLLRPALFRTTWRSLGITGAAVPILVGSAVGPFLGVTLSLVALSRTDVGIASTLMALVPIFLLPFSRWLFRGKLNSRTVGGTVLAVGGVALLFLA